jgi:uroporphyrinogen decarboxylase
MVDVDTATLVGALGMPVEFPADEPAIGRVARLANLANVDTLPPPDIARYPVVQVWVEAARLLCAHFGNEVFIRGNCDLLRVQFGGLPTYFGRKRDLQAQIQG